MITPINSSLEVGIVHWAFWIFVVLLPVLTILLINNYRHNKSPFDGTYKKPVALFFSVALFIICGLVIREFVWPMPVLIMNEKHLCYPRAGLVIDWHEIENAQLRHDFFLTKRHATLEIKTKRPITAYPTTFLQHIMLWIIYVDSTTYHIPIRGLNHGVNDIVTNARAYAVKANLGKRFLHFPDIDSQPTQKIARPL